MGAAAPVTLRDFLEQACESSSDGFLSYPRRLPCDVDQAAPVCLLTEADLRRSPSRSLSSIFFPRSPRSLARISHLSRSLSRRLRGGFWRRRRDEIDADERDSLELPSPVVSSCSASESSEEYADLEPGLLVTEEKSTSASGSEKPSPSPSSSSSTGNVDAAGAAGDGQEALDGDPAGCNQVMEDKQQLSPVSVMDFPFEDDDDGEEGSDAGTCSPSFQQCHANLEGSTAQLLHKTRRFEGLTQVVNPVDLEARFTASEPGHSDDTRTGSNSSTATTTPRSNEHESTNQEDREPDERRLLQRLLKDDAATSASTDEISERLLLDFLAEGLDRLRASAGPVVGTARASDDHDESALVGAAKEWVRGAGPQWGVGDALCAWEAALADMERPGRRWMCVGEDGRDVGAAVEELVMDALVAELVSDLATVMVEHSGGTAGGCTCHVCMDVNLGVNVTWLGLFTPETYEEN